jgi:GNAT superfamily N-acetyltransferase
VPQGPKSTMRFLTYDELTPTMEVDRTLLHLASFGGTFPSAWIELWRRRTKDLADYGGVFAVEGGRLLGQTYALRIPYTFPSGTETVTGIAAVATRPDRGRSGVAHAVLSEIHRREKEAGIRFATLWTNRSWGAHRLYEKLGYRDVYASPWAVHAPVRPSPPKPTGVRPARRTDLADLEELHSRQSRGRLGFLREPNGYLTTGAKAGYLDPGKELVVVRSGGRLHGYAHLEATPYRLICGELVSSSREARRSLITEIQRRARRRPFAFQHTPVTDSPELFPGGEYSVVPTGWYVLMAHSFDRDWSSREARAVLATGDRRFLCLSTDRF